MEITKEQQEQYLVNPDACPVCGGENLEGGEIEFDTDEAWRNVMCEDCGHQWVECFKLWCIDNLEKIEDE